MPIYAYRCESCGFDKDCLQKISDAPLTQCPSCGADAFRKQVTAAGFQLKGSGWYVTDFRGGNNSNGGNGASAAATGAKTDSASSSESKTAAADSAPATASAPAAPAAGTSGTSSASSTSTAGST